jgi:hypothetical protein
MKKTKKDYKGVHKRVVSEENQKDQTQNKFKKSATVSNQI